MRARHLLSTSEERGGSLGEFVDLGMDETRTEPRAEESIDWKDAEELGVGGGEERE